MISDHMLKHDLKHMDGYSKIVYLLLIYFITLLNYSDDLIDDSIWNLHL